MNIARPVDRRIDIELIRPPPLQLPPFRLPPLPEDHFWGCEGGRNWKDLKIFLAESAYILRIWPNSETRGDGWIFRAEEKKERKLVVVRVDNAETVEWNPTSSPSKIELNDYGIQRVADLHVLEVRSRTGELLGEDCTGRKVLVVRSADNVAVVKLALDGFVDYWCQTWIHTSVKRSWDTYYLKPCDLVVHKNEIFMVEDTGKVTSLDPFTYKDTFYRSQLPEFISGKQKKMVSFRERLYLVCYSWPSLVDDVQCEEGELDDIDLKFWDDIDGVFGDVLKLRVLRVE